MNLGPQLKSPQFNSRLSMSTAWRLLGLLRENDGRASALEGIAKLFAQRDTVMTL
jgi:hypothetical protein